MLATTVAIQAQDTIDVKTFQGIQFERAEVPKSYISLMPPNSAITSYALSLPGGLPTPLAILAVAADSANNFLYWYDGQTTTLEIISGTSLRRPEDAMVDEDVAKTSHYSNNFQGDVTLVNGTTGPRSTSLGGANNLASGSETSTGGGELNYATGSTGIIGGGDNNRITGNDGAIWCGSNNEVGSTHCVILGGYNNETQGSEVFIGGGHSNTVLSGAAVNFGGRLNTTSSATSGVVFGGYGSTNSGVRSVIGGGTGQTGAGARGGLLGGYQNNLGAGASDGFLGGGASNAISGNVSALLGGSSNSASAGYAAIGGGQTNTANASHAVVGGGQSNSAITTSHTVALGGQGAIASSTAVVSTGGSTVNVSGAYSVGIGGRPMSISAGGTIGMNGGSSSMTISTASTAAIANMNMWMASNEGTTNEVRFYEAFNAAGAYESATNNYVAFKGPTAMYGTVSGTITLPDAVGSAGQFFSVATWPTPTSSASTAAWTTIPTYDVVAINATAAGQFATTMNDADILRVTSTGTPANRIMTLRNGVTNGMVLTIRFSGANGIRLRDADANLDLQGTGDFDMDANDSLTLVWDASSTKWIETGRMVQN